MTSKVSRRTFAALPAAAAASLSLPAWAQAKPAFRLNSVYSDRDIRAEALRNWAKDIAADFTIEPHYSSSLFKQGTEVVALQRDNLEIANISPFDVSRQIPEWSMLTMAYLFRDAQHVSNFFNSPLGARWTKLVEDKMQIKILAPLYYGTRQVGLKSKTPVIKTPADLASVKLRMPPGDAWQLMGRALGANPTPMAFGEVYTGIQTGAIDGQDNPFPGVNTAKFFEVTGQFVLTSHWIAYDLLAMSLKAWNGLGAKQAMFMDTLNKRLGESTAEHLKMEASLGENFKKAGCDINTPDVAAFRAHAQKVYLESDFAKTWPKGGIEEVAAIK